MAQAIEEYDSDGRVVYSLKKASRDGTTLVVLEPSVLIERLLALVLRAAPAQGLHVTVCWLQERVYARRPPC